MTDEAAEDVSALQRSQSTPEPLFGHLDLGPGPPKDLKESKQQFHFKIYLDLYFRQIVVFVLIFGFDQSNFTRKILISKKGRFCSSNRNVCFDIAI